MRNEGVNQLYQMKEFTQKMKEEEKERWLEEGSQLLKWRKSLGISRTDISKETGIGSSRLRRFEQGEPVKEAKIINRAYKLALEKIEINRALFALTEKMGIRRTE